MTATNTRSRRTLAELPHAAGDPRVKVGFAGSLIRPDDQVRLTFELFNGTVDPASNQIQALLAEEPIFYVVVVRFPAHD